MKKMCKSVLAVFLCAVLVVLTAAPAFAKLTVPENDWEHHVIAPENSEEYVELLNSSLNSLKTELPYAKVSYTAGVPEGGILNISEDESAPLDAATLNYVSALFDGLFSEKNSAFRSLLKTVVGSGSVKNDTIELHRGTKRNELLPIFGKDYVSALQVADDYQILVNQEAGAACPKDIELFFGHSIPLEQARQSSQMNLFNLPDGSVDAELISGVDRDKQSFLSDIKIQDFNIVNARAVASFDENGVLTRYWNGITYDFTIGFAEATNLMAAIMGIDIYQMIISTINTIMTNLGKEGISGVSFLESRKLKITYSVTVEVTDINFSPRIFGDVNDDGKVDSSDARTTLRAAVGLDRLEFSADLLYTDVNFDGVISSADARLILRMAVGLESQFSQVPEGKTVKIIVVEEDFPESEEPEDQEPIGDIEEEFDGFFDIDPAVMPGDLAQFIFDTINSLRDAEGVLRGDIEGIKAIIQSIIDQARAN